MPRTSALKRLIEGKLNQPPPSAAPGIGWILSASVMVFVIVIIAVTCFGGAVGNAG